MKQASIKVGDVFTTNNYDDCVVIEYVNKYKVKVKFITTGYECWCRSNNLRNSRVKDLYLPSVYGVGYIGEGEYLCSVNRKTTKEYSLWKGMLNRCYSTNRKDYHRYGGRGITVCKEWHNFQNFAQWVVEQPNYNKDGFQLDKDLKIKDSKEYSPATCSFVPQNVNSLLTSRNKNRGSCPVGVNWDKIKKKFMSSYGNGKGKPVYLGYYPTSEEAFQAYKTHKENLIKEVAVAEYNKGNIIKEVYDNLMIYEIIPFPS